jgi:hypothetical protein
MDIPKEFERLLQAIMNDYRESLNRAYAFEHNRSSLASLTEAKEVQTATLVELRGLRQQVIIAEKEVQAQYNSDMATEAANTHPWITTFSGRGAAGHARANKKRAITNRKNREIAPYREVNSSSTAQLRMSLRTNEKPHWLSLKHERNVVGNPIYWTRYQ